MTSSIDPTIAFAAAFDQFTRSAFRFESLQEYDVEDERNAYQRFLEGYLSDRCSDSIQEWCNEVSSAIEVGKVYERVRRIEFPLTAYTRFEILTGYRFSSQAGERIFLLENEPWVSQTVEISDFWLFDDSFGFWLNYDPRGKYLGVRRIGAEELACCVRIKNLATSVSATLLDSSSWRELFGKE